MHKLKSKLDFKKIRYKIKSKNIVYRFLVFIISLFATALAFNLFLVPTNISSGGTGGIAIIVNELIGIDTSLVVSIVYFSLLVLGLIFLDLEQVLGIVLSTFLYPLFVKMTANIGDYIVLDYSDKITICLFAAIFTGIGNGLIYKVGYNPGGLGVLYKLLYKYFKIPVGKTNLVSNIIIVGISCMLFGASTGLYSVMVIYITAIFTDKMMLGIANEKQVYIVTEKEGEVQAFIMNYLTHGVTKLRCKTGFLQKDKNVLMCVIPTKEYFILKKGIKEIDKDSFMMVTDAYQSFGGI